MTRLVSWCTLTAWAMAAGNLTSSLAPDVAEPSPLQEGGETGQVALHTLFLPSSPAPPTPSLLLPFLLPLPLPPAPLPPLAPPLRLLEVQNVRVGGAVGGAVGGVIDGAVGSFRRVNRDVEG